MKNTLAYCKENNIVFFGNLGGNDPEGLNRNRPGTKPSPANFGFRRRSGDGRRNGENFRTKNFEKSFGQNFGPSYRNLEADFDIEPQSVTERVQQNFQNFGNQNFEAQNFGNQKYENQNFGNQKYENQNLGNQHLENENFGNLHYDNYDEPSSTRGQCYKTFFQVKIIK